MFTRRFCGGLGCGAKGVNDVEPSVSAFGLLDNTQYADGNLIRAGLNPEKLDFTIFLKPSYSGLPVPAAG